MQIKEITTKNVLTKSNLPVADYSVNPYVGCAHACRYCYASFMKRFTNHRETWGEFVDVKNWTPIKNPQKYSEKEFFIGSVTDPYQPCEEKFKRTRAFLEQMINSNCKISIATKSDLVTRDIDLIKKFPESRVSFSINTLDEKFRAEMDCALSIERRNFCNLIWLENLNLRGNYRVKILDFIREKYPDLTELYRKIYFEKDRSYWKDLDSQIKIFTASRNLKYVRNDDSIQNPIDAPPIVVNYFFHEELVR